jgi:hypothetical protein
MDQPISDVEVGAMSSGIIRVSKNRNYFAASNEPFNDKRLSWEARGVMGYLLSKPDGWECRNHDLINKGPAGRYKMTRILAELKLYGYMRRWRKNDSKGLIVWVTEVFESPGLNPNLGATIARLSINGSPVDGSAVDGKPGHIVSTESASTESVNTERNGENSQKKPSGDYLTHIVEGQTNLQPELSEPSELDKYFGAYRDEALDAYQTLTGLHADAQVGKPAIIDLATQDGFDLERWQNSIKTCRLAGVSRTNIQCMIATYGVGGDYQALREKTWGPGQGKGPAEKFVVSESQKYWADIQSLPLEGDHE